MEDPSPTLDEQLHAVEECGHRHSTTERAMMGLKQYDMDSIDNRDPAFIERALGIIEKPLMRYFRPVISGFERIPDGEALYVANHSGGVMTLDSYVLGIALYRLRGLNNLPYGLAHEVGLRVPGFHQALSLFGVVRASQENAMRLFEAGHKVLVYPGGDLDVMRSFRDRDRIFFGHRRGYIRLALRANVPIIPVVSAGSHSTFIILNDGRWLAKLLHTGRLLRIHAWPINLGLPWGLSVGPIPQFPLPS